jgi:YHS domain-containing protein
MHFTRRLFLCLASTVLIFAQAKVDAIDHDKKGVAIRGYDPVAYFTDNKPTKGDPKFSYSWGGSTWQFASAEHRDLFTQSPDRYAPQYGGYCAYAVSEGHTAEIDPNAWKVVDGKLYLNYSLDVREKWQKEQEARIVKADQNWPSLHR